MVKGNAALFGEPLHRLSGPGNTFIP